MNDEFWMVVGAIALVTAPVAFAAMVAIEARRILRFLRHGIAIEGEVIGEELRGIRYQAPYPVVQFRTPDGDVRQFCSSISRKSRGFMHPERVVVRFLRDSPEKAELFCGFHPYKHLTGAFCVLALSAAFAAFGLPMFFSR